MVGARKGDSERSRLNECADVEHSMAKEQGIAVPRAVKSAPIGCRRPRVRS